MGVVLFHRHYKRFQGGHLKVFHYFEHVRSSPAQQARIRFTHDSVWDAGNPWAGAPELVVGPEEPIAADTLFLAGIDWRQLDSAQRAASRVPIINLIQSFGDALPQTPLHRFTAHPAIRICVSPEIQEALEGARTVRGPIFTVPIGLDLESLPSPRPPHERDIDCLIVALKDPPLGRAIAARLGTARLRGARLGTTGLEGARLGTARHRVLLIDRPVPRERLLGAMARARVAVHLPVSREGAYLPALESMALGALVVCPDCVGNRSFCRDGDTCLMPKRRERAIARAALSALSAEPDELAPMLTAASAESRARSLAVERARFLAILDRSEELWSNR